MKYKDETELQATSQAVRNILVRNKQVVELYAYYDHIFMFYKG